jgi:TetR/AcrR family transcriptional regulator, fatty acid biosynthesis regulator
MPTRAEQKARTRTALIDSVLRKIGDGANYASISLREVAKTAGVVPTSFYRHFGDMDELGLAVVDQLGLDLRRLMRQSPAGRVSRDSLIRRSVAGYLDYVDDHLDLVRFVNQARTGGRASLQTAIQGELDFFGTRLAAALRDLLPGLKPADRDAVADTLLAVLLESTSELLALPEEDSAGRRELQQALEQRIRIVLLGADHLAAKARPGKPRATAKKAVARKSTA